MLNNGELVGSASSEFYSLILVTGSSLGPYGTPYVFKSMDLDTASSSEVSYAAFTARAGLGSTEKWHASNRPYPDSIAAWGNNDHGQARFFGVGLFGVTAITAGYAHSLALRIDGTVVSWGWNPFGQATIPVGLTGVTAIAAGFAHNLALKGDGTVVAWGYNNLGQSTVPVGLTRVTAIAGGWEHSLALKHEAH